MNATQPVSCCGAISGAPSHDLECKLFDRVLVTEYCDGPTNGFVQCPTCGSTYHFITLDWSDSHWVRVLALSRVPDDSIARLQALFAETAPGRGQWVPTALKRATEADLERIEAFLSQITAQEQPAAFVTAWNVRTNEVSALVPVGEMPSNLICSMFATGERSSGSRLDWFVRLGVERRQ